MPSETLVRQKPEHGGSAALVKAAHKLTADLMQPRPVVYWTDLLSSVAIGYGAAFYAAHAAAPAWLRITAGVFAVFAIYRAVMFIHELAHVRDATLPGFRAGWNALVGIPLLIPSFFSEGVHNLHHAKTHYGTANDPEYLPLGRGRPFDLVLFIAASLLFPVGLIFRSLVLVPLAAVVPPLHRLLLDRFSSFAINPLFIRPALSPLAARRRRLLDALTSLYAWGIAAMLATGFLTWSAFLISLAIGAGVALINQLRTLVQHHWENDEGHELDVVEQLLDSVNVPPPGTFPVAWAPLGLRYHALHHLLPGLPYHGLGEAHRRMLGAFPPNSPYHRAQNRNATVVVQRLLRHQAGNRERPYFGETEASPR